MRITELERSVATLEELVRKQMEMLGRNSGNSNMPPSSDGPGTSAGAAKRPKKRNGRKRWAIGSQRFTPDALQRLVARHVATATAKCSSLVGRSITPHTLRHTTAMTLLRRGVDHTVIALWLGHESAETTQIYLHADM